VDLNAHSDLEKVDNSDQTRDIKWFLLVYVLSSGRKVTLFQTDFFERIFSDSVYNSRSRSILFESPRGSAPF
jgi:hypothetical protein